MSSILEAFFDDNFGVSSTSTHKNYKTAVPAVEWPCCNRKDMEPLTVISPSAKEGPWVAGGAALRWYQGLAVGENDIDVFCSSAEQMQRVVNDIKSYGRYSTKFESDNAITMSYWSSQSSSSDTWTIQIIKRRYFMSLQDVVDNFDITVCQIGTDGNQWLLNPTTARDIRERNLRMNMPLQPDAAKRLAKYWTYGYRPVSGLLEAVQTNPIGKKEFQIDGDYENAF